MHCVQMCNGRRTLRLTLTSNLYATVESHRVKKDDIYDVWAKHGMYSEEDQAWQRRVLDKSGLAASGTYLPPAINPSEIITALGSFIDCCDAVNLPHTSSSIRSIQAGFGGSTERLKLAAALLL